MGIGSINYIRKSFKKKSNCESCIDGKCQCGKVKEKTNCGPTCNCGK